MIILPKHNSVVYWYRAHLFIPFIDACVLLFLLEVLGLAVAKFHYSKQTPEDCNGSSTLKSRRNGFHQVV